MVSPGAGARWKDLLAETGAAHIAKELTEAIGIFYAGKFDVLVGTFDSGAVRRLGSGDLECHRRRLE